MFPELFSEFLEDTAICTAFCLLTALLCVTVKRQNPLNDTFFFLSIKIIVFSWLYWITCFILTLQIIIYFYFRSEILLCAYTIYHYRKNSCLLPNYHLINIPNESFLFLKNVCTRTPHPLIIWLTLTFTLGVLHPRSNNIFYSKFWLTACLFRFPSFFFNLFAEFDMAGMEMVLILTLISSSSSILSRILGTFKDGRYHTKYITVTFIFHSFFWDMFEL